MLDHITALLLSERNKALTDMMYEGYFLDADEKAKLDKSIAAYYKAYPELISLANEYGYYPSDAACLYEYEETLYVLAEAENRPSNQYGQILTAKEELNRPLLAEMLTRINPSRAEEDREIKLRLLYAVLPHTCREDQLILAKFLLQDAKTFEHPLIVVPFWVQHKVILDIPVMDNGLEMPLIDAWVDWLAHNTHCNLSMLLHIEGMVFTPGVINILSDPNLRGEFQDLCKIIFFVNTVNLLREKKLKPLEFMRQFNWLLHHNVDLRKFGFGAGANLTELLCAYGQHQNAFFNAMNNLVETGTRQPVFQTYEPLLRTPEQPPALRASPLQRGEVAPFEIC